MEVGATALTPQCHDAIGTLDKAHFVLRACSMCYMYLFPAASLTLLRPHGEHLITKADAISLGRGLYNSSHSLNFIIPDPDNYTDVCRTLNKDECNRWRSCCYAGKACCERQLKMKKNVPKGYCPRRWDGYSCWEDTKAGRVVYGECPDFIEHAIATENSEKTCTHNGTWYMKRLSGDNATEKEWTDFTPCLDREGHLVGVYLRLACSLASVVLLIPAIVILAYFKELHKQHRVRLHLHFFSALLLCAIVSVLWFMLVHRDMMINPVSTQTVLYTNPVWCRVLSFSKIYLTSCTYTWMFCEGYYLHRLISRAFEPPKTLIPLYILGWALPLIPNLAYAVIRARLNDERCWAMSLHYFQWIIDGPHLICLLINLVFLCNIVRILVFQMHSHPHEPSNFRRGLKAVFMLIPLFGLQLILTVYRLPGQKYYEYLHFVITSSQGFFVALIFCFLNGEVLSRLRNAFPCLRCRRKQRPRRFSLQMTQVTCADDCRTPSLSVKTTTPIGSITSSPKKKRNVIDNGQVALLVTDEYGSKVSNDGAEFAELKITDDGVEATGIQGPSKMKVKYSDMS